MAIDKDFFWTRLMNPLEIGSPQGTPNQPMVWIKSLPQEPRPHHLTKRNPK